MKFLRTPLLQNTSGRLFQENAFRSLNAKPNEYYLKGTVKMSNPEETAIKKLENHPRFLAIKQNISVEENYYFQTLISVIYLKNQKL